MRRFFLIALLFSSIYACKPGIPKTVLPPEEMEKVWFDIHVVEGYASTLPTPDTAKKVASAYFKGVYKKYNIDSASYHKSLDYYYNHPKLMHEMYDRVLERLLKAKERQSKLDLKRSVKPIQ